MNHRSIVVVSVVSSLSSLGIANAQTANLSVGTQASSAKVESGSDASKPAVSESASEKGRRPEAGLLELGILGGVLLPSSDHNLQHEPSVHRAFGEVAPEVGLRVAYFPWAPVGFEMEGSVMGSSVEGGKGAGLWAGRGHVIAQLLTPGITPFVLAGAGALGANTVEMGSDSDFAVHLGAGVKVPVDDALSFRFDLRDTLSQSDQSSGRGIAHHPEILGGLGFTIDRTRPSPPPPPDQDGDGVIDAKDKCPGFAGVPPNGCPPDKDGDGVVDSSDTCPTEAGPAPTGCPPPKDRDGDGVIDPKDACPDQPGQLANGCPDPDPDHDKIPNERDACPDQAETVNGFLDQDGCPDELPDAVKRFSGVIQGIEFDFGKATIRPGSRALLDQAAQTLAEYPDLRLLITGHTDNVGARERNIELSRKRAESVKQYLVEKGIDANRLEAAGKGPDQPVATEDTDAARQKNRRIEFTIVTK